MKRSDAGAATAAPRKGKLLGERLIEAGVITSDQLQLGLREQKRTGDRIGEILINLGFVTQELISSALASEAGVTFVQLDNYLVEPAATKAVPESLARRHKIVPILLEPPRLTIAMVNVFDILAIDEVHRATGYMIDVVSAAESSIMASIDRYYGGGGSLEEIIQKSVRQVESGRVSDSDLAAGAPIVRLVEQIFLTAVQEGGTDIHFEPEERIFRVRYRIDGKLRPGPSLPKPLQPAITARVKIISGMNIAETRLPQDGKINFYIGKRKVDLRVSTLPTSHGENMVLRVLDRTRLVLGLEALGFDELTLARFKRSIESRHGIILVCGPTGSGKTTTLYSALSHINALDRSIITLEDPVEYELPIIRQCQINVKAGLTFSAGLRSILRHDPDVILVGEMRDAETAELAIRSSLTGHLVFSTLHTNDAAGAIPRLINMGQEPFLVASSIRAIVGQTLMRTNCSKCRTNYIPSADTLDLAGIPRESVNGGLVKGAGCGQCGGTGFRGRVGVYEIMEVTPAITRLVMERGNSQDLLAAAKAEGMKTMREDAVAKALRGMTTLDEAVRVT
ncbi:MAG: Flp pilus assembly complex ATPase component TadA [Deltaproteobacteria bacterium]|nr:Flp pilus assembly complex ATPase component TadA [Deltaproteobacteria bacterium]